MVGSSDLNGNLVKGQIKQKPKIIRRLNLNSSQKEENPFFIYNWCITKDTTKSITTSLKFKFEQAFENQTPYEFNFNNESYKFIPVGYSPQSSEGWISGLVINKNDCYDFILLYRIVLT